MQEPPGEQIRLDKKYVKDNSLNCINLELILKKKRIRVGKNLQGGPTSNSPQRMSHLYSSPAHQTQ